MPFWSGETLLSRLPSLIEPFKPDQIDCAAYTLRMGSEVYVSPSESEQHPDRITIQKLTPDQRFTIPAGQFAFLLTEEKVTVPRGKIAFISMKSGFKLRGLVNVSGFHVDPGYSGHLIFAVFNAGPKTIHLRRGEDCFLIWYADLDDPESQRAKTGGGHKSISTELVTRISGEVMSFDGLNAKIKELKTDYDDRIHKIERDHTMIKTVGAIIVAVLMTVVITPFAKQMWDSWGSPSIGIKTVPPSQAPVSLPTVTPSNEAPTSTPATMPSNQVPVTPPAR
jgi:dCTP deaminase